MAATDTKPRGGKPDKHVRDALIAAARQDDFAVLRRMAEKVLQKAEEGDMQAVTFVADRIDGKAVQPIAGDSEHPIEHNVIYTPVTEHIKRLLGE